ncbi:MAG: murein biosynthesis integral membrane protein MurJ [Thermomicrobiales bacterium]
MEAARPAASPSDDPPAADRAATGVGAAAAMLIAGTVLSRLLGLGREFLAAERFGTGDEIAAFTIADNVQTLLFDLTVSGMLQAALIPVLAASMGPDFRSRLEIRRISGALVALTLILVGGLSIAAAMFAPTVVRLMTVFGGGQERGTETTELTVELVRWIMPAVVLLGVGTVLMAVLHAARRVTAPALGLAVRNASVILVVLITGPWLGIRGFAAGAVIGALFIVVIQLVPLARMGLLPVLNLQLRHPAVKRILSLYIPVWAGLLVSTIGVVVDRNLAWGAGEDALGAMRYATTLVQMVLGLVAAAIALASLPVLSSHFAAGDEGSFAAVTSRALRLVTVLVMPAAFGLAALAVPVVGLLFGHGATEAAGQRAIVIALLGYLPGTVCAAYDHVLIFAFYARGNTRAPVIVGIIAVGVYIGVATSLVDRIGMLGLVLANSAQFTAHLLVLGVVGRRSFWRRDRALERVIGRCGLASAVSGALALSSWLALRELVSGGSPSDELLAVLVPMAMGAIGYLAMARAPAIEEAGQLMALAQGALGRSGVPRSRE